MPSVSAKQAKLMSAIKHGWHPPAGMHAPSLEVATEFHAADKKQGRFMHAKGGKIGKLTGLLGKWDPAKIAAAQAEADKSAPTTTQIMHDLYHNDPTTFYEVKKDPELIGATRQDVRDIKDFVPTPLQQPSDTAAQTQQLMHLWAKYAAGDPLGENAEPLANILKAKGVDVDKIVPMFTASDRYRAPEGMTAHAGGGKVGNLSRLMDLVERWGPPEYGVNSPDYINLLKTHGWNPKITKADAGLLKEMSEKFPSDNHLFTEANMKELVDKYGLDLLHPLNTHRGMASWTEDNNWDKLLKPGSIWKSPYPQSSSMLEDVAADFSTFPDSALLHISHGAGHRVLPNPFSGQSEVLLPGGDQGAVRVKNLKVIPPEENFGDNLHEADVDRMADGGVVDIADPQAQKDLLLSRATPLPTKTDRFLKLVSHAADRATSTVTDDPHHALARVVSGLASQVAGRAPSGRAEFGRLPNLIDEAKSLPAGMADIGMAGSNILGALSDRYLPHVPGNVGDLLSRLRDATNAYTAKNGDPAPQASRAAEGRSNAVHADVNRAMGLPAPRGFIENAADAGGTMLGQLPIPFGEASTAAKGVKGALSSLGRAVPEYLGPTIKPSVRNYLTGALGGGALGALASSGDPQQPATAQEQRPPMTDEQMLSMLRAMQVQVATAPGGASENHQNLRDLTDYMEKRVKLGAQNVGPPPRFNLDYPAGEGSLVKEQFQ